jgi:hypothetical protein
VDCFGAEPVDRVRRVGTRSAVGSALLLAKLEREEVTRSDIENQLCHIIEECSITFRGSFEASRQCLVDAEVEVLLDAGPALDFAELLHIAQGGHGLGEMG